MPFLPFIFFGAIAAAIAAVQSRGRRTNEVWAEAARELGIVLKPTRGVFGFFGKMSMSGRDHDMDIVIDTHQANDNTYTRYRLKYPSLGLGLTLKRQHALTRIGKFFGYQDIEVGDAVFDEATIVKGEYPDRIVDFLTPARRIAITGLIELYPGAVITDTEIFYQKRGVDSELGQLVSTMQRMLSVARQLRGFDRVTERATERRLAGDVGEALEILESASPTGDPFLDFERKRQVGEIRHARKETRDAIEVFKELKKQAPDDREVDRWAKYRPPQPQGEPGSPAATHTEDAESVAAHLFHKDNYSFDTMEIFEAEYEGSRVSWSGVLKRLRRFDHDRDFGDGPGVKAVFAVATLGSDLYAGREVDAIVRLPRGAETTMEIGGTYRFSGTLSRCDPAMRNLFVTDATLS